MGLVVRENGTWPARQDTRQFECGYTPSAAVLWPSQFVVEGKCSCWSSQQKVRHPDVRHHRAKSQASLREESDIAARKVTHHSRPPCVKTRHPKPAQRQDLALPPATRRASRSRRFLSLWRRLFDRFADARAPACLPSCFPRTRSRRVPV